MKKKSRIFYCSIILMFCQYFVNFQGALAISEGQKMAIIEKCDKIKDDLKNVQRLDARTRVFLGSHYETVLSKFITPLNVRLVENNLSNTDLIENQNAFLTAKNTFAIDFINYQQSLEELVSKDCKNEPEKFYENLRITQEKRKIMVENVAKMKELIAKNIGLVKKLGE